MWFHWPRHLHTHTKHWYPFWFISLPIGLSQHQNSIKLLNISSNRYLKTDRLINMLDTGLDISSLQAPISPALEPNQQVAAVGPIAYLFLPSRHLSAEQSVTLNWAICIGRGFPGNKNWGRWGRYSLQVFYGSRNLHCVQEKWISTRGFSFSKHSELYLLRCEEIIAACNIFKTIWNKNIKP